MSVRAEFRPSRVETCYIRGLGRNDLAGGGADDDRADIGLATLRVQVVERDGPDGLRRDAALEEPDLGLLRVGVPVVAGDLDRLLARHVASGRPAAPCHHP